MCNEIILYRPLRFRMLSVRQFLVNFLVFWALEICLLSIQCMQWILWSLTEVLSVNQHYFKYVMVCFETSLINTH